ncbi:MAG: CcmD family protein [Deltaproteobacteria bacterium]|nr:CcmD family protein [Deltaproteobacteria bacterium]
MNESHLGYLIAAYAVVWIGVLVYVSGLSRRSRQLEREIDELKHLVERRPAA